MKLTDLNTVRTLLSECGTSPDKKYGQNFLISEYTVEQIADNCGAKAEDCILEIGPGIGVLSQKLCERYKKVIAVEIDPKMIEILSKSMKEYDNFTVINADILKTDLDKLFKEHFQNECVTVCANLPYYITSPIIMYLLESGVKFDNITVMIQREVADRLLSKPGTADYGSITPVINYYSDAEKILNVSAGCFYPAPKVDSAVVRLKLRSDPECEPKDKKQFFELIKYAFLQRRKTLVNALSACKTLDKNVIIQAVTECGFDEKIRGEKLSVYDFKRLSDKITELKNGQL